MIRAMDTTTPAAGIAICLKCGQYVYLDTASGAALQHASFDEDRCGGQPRAMTDEERRMLGDRPPAPTLQPTDEHSV